MKFCKKCNCETDRYENGKCKPCMLGWQAKYRAANRDKRRAYGTKYYAANKDKELARFALWREENPEKMHKAAEAWKAANPDRCRLISHNRRAKKRESGGKLSPGLGDRLFKLQKGKCACCGIPLGDDYHLDHIVPLALGGSNTDDNIQLLRAECNMHNGAKHPVDFMRQRGFLL